MSITSLIFGRKPTAVSIANALVIDATTQIIHTYNAQPTKFPAEAGGNLSDHVQLDNEKLSLTGFVSEAPLDTLRSLLGGILAPLVGTEVGGGVAVAAVASATRQILSGNSLLGGTNNPLEADMKNRNLSDTDFPKKAFRYLELVWRNRTPFSIVTSFKKYENMVITSFVPTNDSKTGGSLSFQMTCESLQIVETETIQLPENFIDKAVSATGASKANLGKQTTSSPSSNTDDNSTALFDILN